MSLESTELNTLEHFRFLYETAVEEKDGVGATQILEKMRSVGFEKEAKSLLENTRVMDLVTPACKSTWETDNPTQETL